MAKILNIFTPQFNEKMPGLAFLFIIFPPALAFAPPTRTPYSHITQLHQMLSSEAPPLQTVDDNANNSDPFESYDPSPPQKTIATKDISIGSGSTVGDASSSSSSQLLQRHQRLMIYSIPTMDRVHTARRVRHSRHLRLCRVL